jgi:hypothetical protein
VCALQFANATWNSVATPIREAGEEDNNARGRNLLGPARSNKVRGTNYNEDYSTLLIASVRMGSKASVLY